MILLSWMLLIAAGPDAGVAVAPAKTATRTAQVTASLVSAEELELAAHLELLENLELLEHWEMLSVMPALEEDE